MTYLERVQALLGPHGSRCNKMHLAAGWGFEWKWAGDPPLPNGIMQSRMQFFVYNQWVTAQSWDEDVKPLLEHI